MLWNRFFTNIGPTFFNQNVPFILTALVGFHFDTSNVIYKLILLKRFFTDISPKFFNQKSPLWVPNILWIYQQAQMQVLVS